MKKQLLCLFFSASILAMAGTEMQNVDFSTEIQDLDLMYKELVEKERERFNYEAQQAEEAKKDLEQLTELKAKLVTALEHRDEERAKRFFKKEFDELMERYQFYLKEIDKKIDIDNKFISDFDIIKELSNNNQD